MVDTCVNANHFTIDADGKITPQPWMQLRHVAVAEADPRSREFDSSGGGKKNERVHTVMVQWTNTSPITQNVYGRVTSGGRQVALQARSRALFEQRHGWMIAASPPVDETTWPLEVCDRFGGGADIGKSGALDIGTGFCIHDVRVPSSTIPFMPHITGWFPVAPGQTFIARVEVWFLSDFWENTTIDGGDDDTESLYVHGGTRLDLFACPVIGAPVERATPTIVAATSALDSPDGAATGAKPAGTVQNDLMVAFLSATGGAHSAMTAPAGWTLQAEMDTGSTRLHAKIFTKAAGPSEPASYAFTVPAGLGTEGMIQIVSIRGVDLSDGFDVQLRFSRPSDILGIVRATRNTPLPSIVSYRKFMLGYSFFSHTPFQGQYGQEPAPGLTELTDGKGDLISVGLGYQANPPNPTGERAGKADKSVVLGDGKITGVFVCSGAVL